MGLRDSGLGPRADTLLSPGSALCDHSQVEGGVAGRGLGEWRPWASQVEFCKHRPWAEFKGKGPRSRGGPACRHPEEGLEVGEGGSVGCGSRDYKVAQVALGRVSHSSSPRKAFTSSYCGWAWTLGGHHVSAVLDTV